MSTYENYNKTSHFFDETRSAIGVDIIKNTLKKEKVSLKKQILLDAGCGTGLYSEALVNDVKLIEAIDLNKEMLVKANIRLKKKGERLNIRFHQASIHSLPLADESVDSIMVNQVLHHLSDNAASRWKMHKKIFKEFYRVLKPEGCLIINSCSPEQLLHGFWFYKLIPSALNSILEKTIDIKTLSAKLIKTGFSNTIHEIPKHLILQGDAYFNAKRVLDPVWRSGDSIWSLVSENTLTEVFQKVTSLQKKGELEKFMLKHDNSRNIHGQITFTIARKKLI